jgi:cellulose synthase/poly-beta-1,6-N-acetylglucosamine synthase-like glycosyltransferase
MSVFLTVLSWLLVALVLIGAVPVLAACFEYVLVGLHFLRNHYGQCHPYFPRTAVLIAAWNEGPVIGTTVDRLMKLEFPPDALRVVVVDDASTDDTPRVLQAKAAEYPGRVFHLRRARGGEGKAAALNHGLRQILSDDWMEALLIGDADPIYDPSALRLMTRHLADPGVGAVTAYIKEGGASLNFLARFIGFEYITGQAAARRSQNVLGAIQCLAGGAQLHSRANIRAIGGRIDSSTLAEDTVTTLETQLAGRKVVFEPHALVWAEEPADITGLWKQRLRWARGNVQITRRYRHVWFRRQPGCKVGGVIFGVLWFSLLLQPAFMICGSASLLGLLVLNSGLAWRAFGVLWLANATSYLFITAYTLLIDPKMGKRTWAEGIMFTGAVNLIVIISALLPLPMYRLAVESLSAAGLRLTHGWVIGAIVFIYAWQAAAMGAAYLAKFAETRPLGGVTSRILIYAAGYGPLMCAVTFASYVKEISGAESRWDKTEKTGKAVAAA